VPARGRGTKWCRHALRTHVTGSGLSWLSRTLKNDDLPNPNRPDIDVYPWLDGGSVRSSVITPLWYNYWPRPERGRPITRLLILLRPPIGASISTTLWQFPERSPIATLLQPRLQDRLTCYCLIRYEWLGSRLVIIIVVVYRILRRYWRAAPNTNCT
jgi:hypothetical protein